MEVVRWTSHRSVSTFTVQSLRWMAHDGGVLAGSTSSYVRWTLFPTCPRGWNPPVWHPLQPHCVTVVCRSGSRDSVWEGWHPEGGRLSPSPEACGHADSVSVSIASLFMVLTCQQPPAEECDLPLMPSYPFYLCNMKSLAHFGAVSFMFFA